jgi:hypothetical protein
LDLDVNGRILLKLILKEREGRWKGVSWVVYFRIGTSGVFFTTLY